MPAGVAAVCAVAYSNPYTASESYEDMFLADFLDDLLPKLASRRLSGNAAKDAVVHEFGLMLPLMQKWCQRILLKNLRCGVQGTTVNKVWPDTIKEFTVALAKTLETSHDRVTGIKIVDTVNYPVRVEPKLDGLRCIALKQNGIVTMFTRNGTELDTLPRIKATLEKAEYDNIVLDGEAMGEDWNESAAVLMSKKSKKDDSNIVYNVFDAVPLETWVSQTPDVNDPYSDRLKRVEDVVRVAGTPNIVRQVVGYTVNTEAELLEIYQRCINEAFEGVMLKNIEAPYIFKRSDAILKMKPVATYEGVVVGWYKGKLGTKREDVFGGFNMLLSNGVVTNVGGGFNDKLKAEIQLVGPDSYVGKVIEVEGQPDPTPGGLTKDGKIRFPTFCRFRDDSDVDPLILLAYENYKR
jgi:DNA ligase 1